MLSVTGLSILATVIVAFVAAFLALWLLSVLTQPKAFASRSVPMLEDQGASGDLILEDGTVIAGSALSEPPFPAWRQDEDGGVQIGNAAYQDLAARIADGDDTPNPLPAIFEEPPLGDGSRAQRARLTLPNCDAPQWFSVFRSGDGVGTTFFAVPADDVVRAEVALKQFVQTLTKTFAQLPTGLAIFDRKRQLALFNPALTDLMNLTPEFLSSRPTLYDFLDALRERRMMPEPKDYRSWRQQLAQLEAAASDGTYTETWTLPTGQTYRVTGRPHPDGAVAFLFSDITAEISLTRRFRSELELGQSVFDTLDQAIAVFAPNGSLTMSNSAFAAMWDVDPCETLGDVDICALTRDLSQKCDPSPVWGEIRDFVQQSHDRAEWTGDLFLTTGAPLQVRVVPLAGNSTMVCFTDTQPAEVALPQAPDLAQTA